MNPDRRPPNEAMDLPPVVTEKQPEPQQPSPEKIGDERNPEYLSNQQTGFPVSPAATTPNTFSGIRPTSSSTTQTPSAQPADPGTTTLIADDSDLIEKEWVERAKEIVHKTKDNPYLQNKAITKMKVDYIKKRYNKDIKLNEDT